MNEIAPKGKKGWYKRWYGILGIIVVLFIILASIGDSKKGNVAVENAGPEITTTNEANVAPTESATVTTDNKVVSKATDVKTTQPIKTTSTATIPTNSQYTYYSVSSVVDGDTIKVNIEGTVTTLRLIGMDTPETVDPRKPVQCFGKEASNKAKELLTGKKVRVEKDSTQGDLDKYGRTLAYVYREDGLFYNKYMIEQGYAHEYTYSTPYKYQSEFKTAQKSAQTNLMGLWSPNTCNGDTANSSILTPTTTTTTQTTGEYYTSSYYSSKYYYPKACNGWKSLSAQYLKSYGTLEALLAVYPSKTESPQCQ